MCVVFNWNLTLMVNGHRNNIVVTSVDYRRGVLVSNQEYCPVSTFLTRNATEAGDAKYDCLRMHGCDFNGCVN